MAELSACLAGIAVDKLKDKFGGSRFVTPIGSLAQSSSISIKFGRLQGGSVALNRGTIVGVNYYVATVEDLAGARSVEDIRWQEVGSAEFGESGFWEMELSASTLQDLGFDLSQGVLVMAEIFDPEIEAVAELGNPTGAIKLVQYVAPDQDCNGNKIADTLDIIDGRSSDCQENGIPDECDPDLDGDGRPDDCDPCPTKHNGRDEDEDGHTDCTDNCTGLSNTNQFDVDQDGVGDACDVCPRVADSGQGDLDDDGVGDLCDNCPITPNPNQADENADGIGDADHSIRKRYLTPFSLDGSETTLLASDAQHPAFAGSP